MTGYVELVDFTAEDDIEALTPDNTIGELFTTQGEDDIQAVAKFHVGRLRRALLAYEEIMEQDAVYLSVIDHPENDTEEPWFLLGLQSVPQAHRAIVLASMIPSDDDELEAGIMSARSVERQELTAPEDGTLRIEIDGTAHQYLVDEDAEITIEWSKR